MTAAADSAGRGRDGRTAMLKSLFQMVEEFHQAFGVPAPRTPCIPGDDILLLRCELIKEEFREYFEASFEGDIIKTADALADLAYVVIGTAVAHGLARFDEIFAEVHRSNMSKLGADGKPIYRADGKVLKGPNFTPPDIASLVKL